MSYPWYVRALLGDPARVMSNLTRMQRAGVVDARPSAWQLSLGVLRLWHRIMLRAETVGTSAQPVRETWRARVLAYRLVRLPFLLASRAVIPFDFTGLRSSPERLIDHVLGAHHDGRQIVFDLELLAGHGHLEQLAARVDAVIADRDPRARWLRDLAVFVGYHEELARAVETARPAGPPLSLAERRDPDLSLRGFVAWCAAQPTTPAATIAAWSDGRFRFDARPPQLLPTTDALLRATPSALSDWFAAGHPLAPEQLAGSEYHGTSLGIPGWIERLAWKTFRKVFVADREVVRGWNVRVERRDPPSTFGHFLVVREGTSTLLDYGRGGNRRADPISALRDPLVSLTPGSVDRLLGRTLVSIGGRRIATPSFFLLERAGPVARVAVPPRSR